LQKIRGVLDEIEHGFKEAA